MTGTLRRSLFVAATYFVVATVYILVSSSIAESQSANIADLSRVERLKGILFVALTAGVVFAATFGAMRRAERITNELSLQREAILASERSALAGMMAAAIAHDANNVLASLMLDLEVVHREGDDRESLDNARAGVERLAALNRRLLDAARSTSTDVGNIDVARAVKETLAVLHFHRALRTATIDLEAAEGIVVRANPVLIHQVIGNFAVNAGEATDGKGRIAIKVRSDDPSGAVTIDVDDDGPGVPLDRRDDLFSALKTTKATGTGLGLYSARACAIAVGGRVEVGDSPLGGARFTLVIPRASVALTPASSP
jgi:signal transduction histidine kinase